MNVKNVVFACFLLHSVFYLWSIENYGIIFGMQDVDNYLMMCGGSPQWYDFRHIFMYAGLACNQYVLAVFLPFVFWFGVVYQHWKLTNDNDAFIAFFGTASFWLFTVVGLWSQYICLMFLGFSISSFLKGNRILGIVFALLALTYFPVWWFLFGLFANLQFFVAASLVLVSVERFQFFIYPAPWHPVLTFLMLFSPAVIVAGYKQKVWDKKVWAQFFVYGVQYLARMTVFMYYFLRFPEMNKSEKALLVVWWVLLGVYFLRLWYLDASCAEGLSCRVGMLIKGVR